MALWYRTRASRVRRPSIGEDRLGQLWASTVRCTGADPQLAWITSQRKTDRRSTPFIKCLRFIGSPFDGEPLFRACGPPEAGQLRWSCTPWEASNQVRAASDTGDEPFIVFPGRLVPVYRGLRHGEGLAMVLYPRLGVRPRSCCR